MNRLLINMVNKVKTIKAAIAQIDVLKNNGSIELNGLNKMVFTRGETTDQQFEEAKERLINEMYSLQERIWRMGGEL